MYRLEIYDGCGKGIIALRKPESLENAVEMVLDTANKFTQAKQWILLCMGKAHSVWERNDGKMPRLTSSVIKCH